ncbi:MaoC/PaaZ C-terminal domain-containing protein [Methylobacterium nigriterrae]|uniref:MaoC/PaaZ C-terminal domain-containing protein n=1 Tax=Methylobacterium nigriterrae TaxID=3127512 RepID=UPI003014149B
MRVFQSFDEIKAAVGTEVGVSDWIVVSQERIEQFAQATGGNQWVHVDVERAARELPTGTRMAHGLLTLSFAPVFIRDVMSLQGLKITLNYGQTASATWLPCRPDRGGAAAQPSLRRKTRRRTACELPTASVRDRESRPSGLGRRGHRAALPVGGSDPGRCGAETCL